MSRAERAATSRAERAATSRAERAATSRAERAAMSLADRAEIVFLEPLTAGLFPTLETRISDMSLPVAALIFAF
jgi:hypothetical protein